MRVIAALFAALLFGSGHVSEPRAQTPEAPPLQVRELLKLLSEPDVRSRLDQELKKSVKAERQGRAQPPRAPDPRGGTLPRPPLGD